MANEINVDIQKAAYELYKQNWVDTHVSPEMRLQSVREYQYYLDDCIADGETPVSMSEWIEENGYGSGSLYVCFDEFLNCEYRDRAYIKSLLKDGSFIEAYEADVRSEQELLHDIEEVERLSDNVPDGQVIDADTILADLIQKCDYEMTGFAQDIFNIWKQSSDKKSVEMMFFEFTDTDFSEYLDLCKKQISR